MQTATIADVPILKIGHGLALMTWIPTPPPEAQCFEALKAGLEAAPPGAKVLLNSGRGSKVNSTGLTLQRPTWSS
ncbi:hypothetical protein FRC09_005533 [Ceratobasidium sp. 395]|nr:hypothetical protein FRC09_005533 [Ceratobasidium sp. 395]